MFTILLFFPSRIIDSKMKIFFSVNISPMIVKTYPIEPFIELSESLSNLTIKLGVYFKV